MSDDESLRSEIKHVKALPLNNYYNAHINRTLHVKTKSNIINVEIDQIINTIITPYIAEADKLARFLEKQTIRVRFGMVHKILKLISGTKDELPKISTGVYWINSSCGQCYVSQMGQMISIRLKEYHINIKYSQTQLWAVVEYACQQGHSIDFNVSCKTNCYWPRLENILK